MLRGIISLSVLFLLSPAALAQSQFESQSQEQKKEAFTVDLNRLPRPFRTEVETASKYGSELSLKTAQQAYAGREDAPQTSPSESAFQPRNKLDGIHFYETNDDRHNFGLGDIKALGANFNLKPRGLEVDTGRVKFTARVLGGHRASISVTIPVGGPPKSQ